MTDSEFSAGELFEHPELLEKLLEGISNQLRKPIAERLESEGLNLEDNGIWFKILDLKKENGNGLRDLINKKDCLLKLLVEFISKSDCIMTDSYCRYINV